MRILELDRINELARKARTTELTMDEVIERDHLRESYLLQINGQLNNILATVTVIDPNGNDVTPNALKTAQLRGMMQMI